VLQVTRGDCFSSSVILNVLNILSSFNYLALNKFCHGSNQQKFCTIFNSFWIYGNLLSCAVYFHCSADVVSLQVLHWSWDCVVTPVVVCHMNSCILYSRLQRRQSTKVCVAINLCSVCVCVPSCTDLAVQQRYVSRLTWLHQITVVGMGVRKLVSEWVSEWVSTFIPSAL